MSDFTQKHMDLLDRMNIEGPEYEEERGTLASLKALVASLVPKPKQFDPFKVEMKGVGEVIERSDPRHPKYQAPDAPVDHPELQPT